MALVKSGTFGDPVAAYELHATQTAGSGNNRTVKVTMKLKVNGSTTDSKYGFPLNWIARVKDSYSSAAYVKGREYWYGTEGFREYSQTLTVDVGTTSSTSITVGFQLKRSDGGSSTWNQTITETFLVDKTNTKPYFPTAQQYINVRQGGSASGTLLSGIIPENISTVYVEWGQASDAEGGTLTYALNHRINGGNWSQIDLGTDRAHSYSIGEGNQGQTLEYYVDAKDNGGLWSDKVYSTKITKNTFTGSTLNNISSIAYNTSSLTLSWSAPSNTTSHANKSKFNFTISCDGLTLYNATASNATTSLTFKIVTSALTDGTPYILKNDLKNKFANTSYKGNLTFTLTSSNAYGSSKTSSKVCAVNLQSTPNAVSSAIISTDTAKSTCYQKPISSVNSYFFIPDGSKVIRVEWSAVTGNIGEPISYDVYVAYGSEDWSLIRSNLTTTYYNHTVPKQTVSRTVKYRVVTKTSYGTSASKDTAAQTLHYYNVPTITIGAITRASTSATVNITVASKTSLSGVTTVGTWTCYNKGTTTSVSTGNLSTSQSAQNISVKNLTETGQYDLKITYKDNTVFSSNVTTSAISIGQMLPVFFVNKYGIGVNGEMANANSAVKIKGSVFPHGSYNGKTDYDSTPIGLSIVEQGEKGSSAGYPSDYITTLTVKHSANRQFQFSVDNSGNNLYFRGAHVNNTDGVSTGWSSWKKVYHSANKPSKSDVGLSNVNNWGASSSISANSTSQYATTNMVAQVRAEKLNASAGVHNGALTISENSKQLIMGCGIGDVFFKNSESGGYLQFYDDKTLRIDGITIGTPQYPIIDRDTTRWFTKIAPVMSDGVMEVGRYIDFHKTSSDPADYTVRLDANGSVLWCSTTIQQASDKNMKEDIQYLDEIPMMYSRNSSSMFKDFIKDFRFATFRYKGAEQGTFGFIAQDVEDSPVGQLMVSEFDREIINKKINKVIGTEKTLSFDLSAYTTVVAKGLQETIKELDDLKEENKELKNRIIEIEKRLEEK